MCLGHSFGQTIFQTQLKAPKYVITTLMDLSSALRVNKIVAILLEVKIVYG